MQVLVVEDDATVVGRLTRGLESAGYDVTVTADGQSGERLALCTDLVLLGQRLSSRDGMKVLATIKRSRPRLPVVLLSGNTDAAAKVEGLDQGASDYVTKPFDLDELLARIRAHLRDSAAASQPVLSAAGIRLNQITREAARSAQVVRLPQRESELLAYLMQRAGEVCTRREILAEVWELDHDPGTNVVQVYVGYLRQKLSLPGSPTPIETVRSVGYRLKADG
jgi:DNA-binding response OmpR family regulator